MNLKYHGRSEATIRNVEERKIAWRNVDCQILYRKLINASGGFSVVRKGMRAKAKDLAINAYLRGVEPDYSFFEKSVKIANEITNQRKEKKLLGG